MFYEKALIKFRENYKEKNIHLLFNNGDEKIEFFPELNGYDIIIGIQYHVISSKNNNIGTNNTVGYLDHLPFDLLTQDKWSLVEESCYCCKYFTPDDFKCVCTKNKIKLIRKEVEHHVCDNFESKNETKNDEEEKIKKEVGFRDINIRKFIKKEK